MLSQAWAFGSGRGAVSAPASEGPSPRLPTRICLTFPTAPRGDSRAGAFYDIISEYGPKSPRRPAISPPARKNRLLFGFRGPKYALFTPLFTPKTPEKHHFYAHFRAHFFGQLARSQARTAPPPADDFRISNFEISCPSLPGSAIREVRFRRYVGAPLAGARFSGAWKCGQAQGLPLLPPSPWLSALPFPRESYIPLPQMME